MRVTLDMEASVSMLSCSHWGMYPVTLETIREIVTREIAAMKDCA